MKHNLNPLFFAAFSIVSLSPAFLNVRVSTRLSSILHTLILLTKRFFVFFFFSFSHDSFTALGLRNKEAKSIPFAFLGSVIQNAKHGNPSVFELPGRFNAFVCILAASYCKRRVSNGSKYLGCHCLFCVSSETMRYGFSCRVQVVKTAEGCEESSLPQVPN